MFTKKSTPTPLDEEITRLTRYLAESSPADENYATAVDQLTKLQKIQNESSDRISKDTLALIAANLTGIVMIIKHEQVNVIATKAMSLVLKPK